MIGRRAGYNIAGGNGNTVIGRFALYTSTAASDCVAIGKQAMYAGNATRAGTVAIGKSTLNNLSTGDGNTVDSIFDLTIGCIDQVVEGEDVYESSSFSKKELLEFMDNMDSNQFQSVQNFFETMPKLSHTVKVKNPNTGVDNEILLEGLNAFFA